MLELCQYVFKHRQTFTRNRDIHDIQTRSRDDFHADFAKLNIRKNSPNIMGLKVFNKLPNDLKTMPTLSLFKRHLKRFFLENSFYSMDEFFSG